MHDVIKLIRMAVKLAVLLLKLGFTVLGSIFSLIGMLFGRGRKSFEGSVRVIDGDSLASVIDGREIKIRIHGIDAPEFDQPEGAEATRTLRRLMEGHSATIEPVETDRYGRTVARILLEDGTDVGAEMVRRGMAIADTRYTRRYASAQSEAKRNGAGIWGRGGFIEPAQWRSLRGNS